jgi:hypothetical protein
LKASFVLQADVIVQHTKWRSLFMIVCSGRRVSFFLAQSFKALSKVCMMLLFYFYRVRLVFTSGYPAIAIGMFFAEAKCGPLSCDAFIHECRLFSKAYIGNDNASVVPKAADLLVAALEHEAHKIVEQAAPSQAKSPGSRKAQQAEDYKYAMVTALRHLLRSVAAEVPNLAHLPVKRSVMLLIMQQLQPRCSHSPSVLYKTSPYP